MTNAILARFFDLYLEDQDAGIEASLEDYKRKFPGHEKLIELEYRALHEPIVEECFTRLPGESPFGTCLEADLLEGIHRPLAEYLERFPEEAHRVCTDLGILDAVQLSIFGKDSQSADSMTGQTIGPYQIKGVLGRGGQAAVFLAQDSRLDRLVALKVFSAISLLPGSNARIRFEREANLIAKLEHPGVVRIHEIGEDGPVRYIAMQYVEGKTLAELLQRHRSAGLIGAVDLRGTVESHTQETETVRVMRVARFFERLVRAVHTAHEAGILHRDIKPANVMVTPEGKPVLLDFGLSRDEDEDTAGATQTGDVLGTPRYMSPEQMRAEDRSLDGRTDVYSLGATLYECLTGHRVVEGDSSESVYTNALSRDPQDVRSLNPAVSLDLKYVLDTSLEKERERRFANALDFAEDLRRVRSEEPVRARPTSLVYRLQKTARRNKILLGGAISTVLAVLIGAGFVIYFAIGQSEQKAEARLALYKMGLNFAASALESGELAEAEEALGEVPPELRGWEWRHLRSNADSVISMREYPEGKLLLTRAAWRADGLPIVAQVSPDAANVLLVRDALTGDVLQSLTTPGAVSPVALSEDGKSLVAVDDSLLTVWDVNSGAKRFEIVLDSMPTLSLTLGWRYGTQFSGDGLSLVAQTDGDSILVVDSFTGNVRVRIDWASRGEGTQASESYRGGRANMAISPDSKYLFGISSAGELSRLIDLGTGGILIERTVLNDKLDSMSREQVTCAAWSPDGTLIALRTTQHEFYLLDAETLDLVAKGPKGSAGYGLEFLPDGSRLAVAHNDSLCVRDLAEDSSITWLDTRLKPSRLEPAGLKGSSPLHPLNSHGLSVSADGKQVIAYWGRGYAVLAIDSFDSEPLAEESYVYFNAWSPDGSLLATAGWSQAVYIWEPRTGELLARIPMESEVVSALGFSPDGERLLAMANPFRGEESLYRWNVATGEREVAFVSPEGSRGPESGVIKSKSEVASEFWRQAASGTAFAGLDVCKVLRKSPSGRLVVGCQSFGGSSSLEAASLSGVVEVRDGEGRKVLSEITAFPVAPYSSGKYRGVTAVAVDPSERALVVCGTRASAEGVHDAYLRRLDLASGELLTEVPFAAAYSLDYHPSGNRIAAGLDTGVIVILDAETLETLFEFQAHDWYVASVSFSPDGTRLASSSGDSTTRIWDSVEASVRYLQARKAETARREVEPLVGSLLQGLVESALVADALRADELLSKLQRREALIELLRRTAPK